MPPQREVDHDDQHKCLASFSSPPYRLERVFPVYAMGIPNSHALESSLHHHFDGVDTIWDAIREETKLEVPQNFISCCVPFFFF